MTFPYFYSLSLFLYPYYYIFLKKYVQYNTYSSRNQRFLELKINECNKNIEIPLQNSILEILKMIYARNRDCRLNLYIYIHTDTYEEYQYLILKIKYQIESEEFNIFLFLLNVQNPISITAFLCNHWNESFTLMKFDRKSIPDITKFLQ